MRNILNDYKEKLDGIILEKDKLAMKNEQLEQLSDNLGNAHH